MAAPAGKRQTPLEPIGEPIESFKDVSPSLLSSRGGCPLRPNTSGKRQTEEDINPLNMMPSVSNTPTPNTVSLSTFRTRSGIPKTGSSEVWEYPSALQFYNALLRKDKSPESSDMATTVWVHNLVNERSWEEVLKWESMHESQCPKPSLTRFVGRYDDISIKARVNMFLFGKDRPFDRHDWFVDRCGKEVRYVIDYYDEASGIEGDNIDVRVDVRPAIDKFGAFWDRMRRPWYNLFRRKAPLQSDTY